MFCSAFFLFALRGAAAETNDGLYYSTTVPVGNGRRRHLTTPPDKDKRLATDLDIVFGYAPLEDEYYYACLLRGSTAAPTSWQKYTSNRNEAICNWDACARLLVAMMLDGLSAVARQASREVEGDAGERNALRQRASRDL